MSKFTALYAFVVASEPVGKLLDGVINVFAGCRNLAPTTLRLPDSTITPLTKDVLDFTATVSGATVELIGPRATYHATWAYGRKATHPYLTAHLRVEQNELSALDKSFVKLGQVLKSPYSFIDTTDSLKWEEDRYSLGVPFSAKALFGLYWFNQIGSELAQEFEPSAETLDLLTSYTPCVDGTQCFHAKRHPGGNVEPALIAAIVRDANIFEKYDPKAAFSCVPFEFDLSRIRSIPEPYGEVVLNDVTVRTYQRTEDLRRYGFLLPLPNGFEFMFLVQPKYCELLGLSVNDMLVLPVQSQLKHLVTTQIDAAFEEIPDLNTLDRVREAHKRGSIGLSPAILSYVLNQCLGGA